MEHHHCKGIWRLASFTGRGRSQVPLRALFQAQAGTFSRTTDVL